MKNLLYTVVFAGVLVLGTTSCESLLDTEPSTALTQELALDEVAGYEGLLFAAYSRTREFDFYGQDEMIAPEVMADNMRVANNTGRYTGQQVNAVNSHFNNRYGLYLAIQDCNMVIGLIDGVVDVDPTATQDDIDQLKGEAYFLRAVNYFALVRAFSYMPGQIQNGWNEGVILRTSPSLSLSDVAPDNPPARATVSEVYDLMESDLQAAINLLGETGFPSRATESAARALLARVYLYEEDWANAASQADAALAATGAAVVTDSAAYMDSWGQTNHPEAIWEMEIRSVDWSTVDGVNNSLHTITMDLVASAQFAITATQELIDAIELEAGDIRRGLYTDPTQAGNQGRGFYMMNKWQGEQGDFLENLPIIRASEVLLTSAEAKERQSTGSGRADLNTLRNARGLGDFAGADADLLDEILRQRRIELAGEGHRFYDLKRQGVPITKPAILGVDDVPADDFRILAPVPLTERQANPNLKQNPGY